MWMRLTWVLDEYVTRHKCKRIWRHHKCARGQNTFKKVYRISSDIFKREIAWSNPVKPEPHITQQDKFEGKCRAMNSEQFHFPLVRITWWVDERIGWKESNIFWNEEKNEIPRPRVPQSRTVISCLRRLILKRWSDQRISLLLLKPL